MEIKRIKLDEKIIAGISIRTNNSKAKVDISKLWNEFFSNNIIKKINHKNDNSYIYGVYNDYENDMNGNYTLTAGVQIPRKEISKYNVCKIKKGNYILFHNKGILPDVVFDTWKYIWNYFEENKDIKRKYVSDFESYEDDKSINIYISVK